MHEFMPHDMDHERGHVVTHETFLAPRAVPPTLLRIAAAASGAIERSHNAPHAWWWLTLLSALRYFSFVYFHCDSCGARPGHLWHGRSIKIQANELDTPQHPATGA